MVRANPERYCDSESRGIFSFFAFQGSDAGMRIKSFGYFLFAACLLGASTAANSQGLKSLETPDLRLLYFDPDETYLSPHAARSFHNSLARQKSIFGFDPDEKTTVLIKDYSDYANASAGTLPRNILLVDVSPLSFAF